MWKEGNEIELYPTDGYYVGAITSIMSEGTVLKYGEALTGSVEDPIVTIQIHEVVNGTLVATNQFCVDHYKSLWIEGEYTGEKSYSKYETKSIETPESVEETDTTTETVETPKETTETTEGEQPTHTTSENDEKPETVVEQKSLSGSKELFKKTLQEHEESIIMLSEMLQKSHERINVLEKTLIDTVTKLKSTIVDAPLQYKATKQEPTKAKSIVQKQIEEIQSSM